ncbi:FeoB-associated Cys-rich membrane protein [Fibrisoma montanum]|uniref:FeoB-associated Cys-rich membrane protein n=1 Tax=Fibrisoma montanum TaxID=2305895 RepID=A0A418MB29_9BACT|nr:FeoB-associated Cys-rich membrane protein [Fibrisoma montanum]RIV23536.1 FeoB-associated Cys-rich membrane protein [Fibrisoma montanum]
MQELVILLVFLAAVGYLIRRAVQSLARPKTGGCGKNCGCDTKTTPATPERLSRT